MVPSLRDSPMEGTAMSLLKTDGTVRRFGPAREAGHARIRAPAAEARQQQAVGGEHRRAKGVRESAGGGISV